MLTSRLFIGIPWIEHGFGTRVDTIDQDAMASLDQIHSANVLSASVIGRAGKGDALITDAMGLVVSIRTADCLPILLADPKHRAVAAVHAGWRGTAAEIVRHTIDKMRHDFDTSAADLFAAIGPGIGGCCYHVGEEVARRFGLHAAGKIDLAAINRELLMTSGVPASQIDTLPACTMCDGERWWSYRREGEAAGRMISWIRIQESEVRIQNESR